MPKQVLPARIDKGEGRVLVLLHGLGNNYKSWTYVLNELDYTKYRVIALDLIGFGDAPKPEDIEYTPEDQADAVIITLDKLNAKNAVIAGHSMGCVVAIAIAKKRPDLASRLVLLGAPLYQHIPKGNWWSRITRAEGAYFTLFKFVSDNPEVTITAIKAADALVPIMKGMEVTEETWPAYKASLRKTIMQDRIIQ